MVHRLLLEFWTMALGYGNFRGVDRLDPHHQRVLGRVPEVGLVAVQILFADQ